MSKPTARQILAEKMLGDAWYGVDVEVNGVTFNVVDTGDKIWATATDSNDVETLVGEWDYADAMPVEHAAVLLVDDMYEYAA